MLYHAILGLLRDGRPRHGYDLIRQYRLRSGRTVNPGNFYRDCSKLVAHGLIALDANPPDADPRRIPYRITPSGCREFDAWLLEPKPLHSSFESWIVFADMLPADDRTRLLDQMRDALWADGKALGTARERLVARGRRVGEQPAYQPAALLALRRIKQVTAELEFLQELRRELGATAAVDTAAEARDPATSAPTAAAVESGRRKPG
jgi:DNA-binding PadR family transcriptional regulator